jgi:GT2 family glycosyltransferase
MNISVIIPVFNSSRLLGDTLRALHSGTRVPDELIVVDDKSTDASAAIAEEFGARVVRMRENVGPAACRNEGALLSRGDLLVFLDADTCVHPDALERMERHFLLDPHLNAVFGSYDDAPPQPGLSSQFRNLAHCYVHHSSRRDALTFWSGCGAVQRHLFFDVDGFDEMYRQPSIEDIELGYRMTDRGARILLDPEITVTHTKRWTLWSGIVTDVVYRGVPWMLLLLERGRAPDDLNLKRHHRIATVLTGASFLCLIGCLRSPYWLIPCSLLALLAVSLDRELLRFIHRKRGRGLMAASVAMILLQNLCKFSAALVGLLAFGIRITPANGRQQSRRRSRLLNLREAKETEAMQFPTPI